MESSSLATRGRRAGARVFAAALLVTGAAAQLAVVVEPLEGPTLRGEMVSIGPAGLVLRVDGTNRELAIDNLVGITYVRFLAVKRTADIREVQLHVESGTDVVSCLCSVAFQKINAYDAEPTFSLSCTSHHLYQKNIYSVHSYHGLTGRDSGAVL